MSNIHFSDFDVLVIYIVLIIAPLTLIVSIILGFVEVNSKSINVIRWESGLSIAFLILSLIVLLHQLQGNYKEEIHLALIALIGMIGSIVNVIRIKKKIKKITTKKSPPQV